jgi:predicted phage tail protein
MANPPPSALDRIQADPRLRTRDDSGVAAIVTGTVVWAVIWVALLVVQPTWAAGTRAIAVAATGAGLGLIGIAIVVSRQRRLRRRREHAAGQSGPD